jgi:periplasmic protein CpxP/Spy
LPRSEKNPRQLKPLQTNPVYTLIQRFAYRRYPKQESIMRKTFRSSAVLLSLALVGGAAGTLALIGTTASYSQEPQGPPPGHGQWQGQGRHHGPNAEFETKMLTKRLGLTPDQAARVEPILAAQNEQFKALRPAEGTQPDFKAMHEQRKTIMDQTKQQLSTVLSTDQMAELAKMHHGPGGPGGPGGPHGHPGGPHNGQPSSGE